MATYAEHKTAIDAAHPTPTPVWVQVDHDPSHDHDDTVVARSQISFLGRDYTFEIHVGHQGKGWFVWTVDALDEPRRGGYGASSWAAAQTSFATSFETECEYWRAQAAGIAHAREVLTAAGITYTPPAVRRTNARLREMTVVGIDWPYTPAFDGSVLAYSGSTALAEHRLKITTEDPDATATVTLNGTAVTLNRIGVAQLALVTGENNVVITVTAEDGTTAAQYTIAITRT